MYQKTTKKQDTQFSFGRSASDSTTAKQIYVGLQNQGATCYMNSALQSLFHIPIFRNLIFRMPTTGKEDASKNIPLSLQRLFIFMQLAEKNEAISTKPLTESFGWTTAETLMQHDIEEFLHLLIDNLETKLKAYNMDQDLKNIFVGKTRSFIRGKDIDFKTEHIDEFYDIALNVKGCSTLEESFKQFTAADELTGENQYQTEDKRKIDAFVGTEFLSFPDVILIHLRRFQYDYSSGRLVKLHDKFTFPSSIDLSPFLAEDSDQDKNDQKFLLKGVLVHSGLSPGGGHYYAFINTTGGSTGWYKFNDSYVTKATEEESITKNFGGLDANNRSQTFSAYMLIYIRASQYEKINHNLSDEELPEHLKSYYKTEKNSKKNSYSTKSYTFTTSTINVNLITVDDFKNTFSLSLPQNPVHKNAFTIKKTATFHELQQMVSDYLKYDIKRLVMFKYDSTKLGERISKSFSQDKTYNKEQNIFAYEVPEGQSPEIASTRSLQLIKIFDPKKQELKFHSVQFPPKTGKPGCLVPYIFDDFEKISPENIKFYFFDNIYKTLKSLNYWSNDAFTKSSICIYQISSNEEETSQQSKIHVYEQYQQDKDGIFYCFNSAIHTFEDFYYITNHSQNIEICPADSPNDEPVTLKVINNIQFSELKKHIAHIAKFDYDSKKSSIQLFKPKDEKTPSDQPIPSYTDISKYMTTDPASYNCTNIKIFYKFIPDISEENSMKLKSYHFKTSTDAIKVDFQSIISLPHNIIFLDFLSAVEATGFNINDEDGNPQYQKIRILQFTPNNDDYYLYQGLNEFKKYYADYRDSYRFELVPEQQLNRPVFLLQVCRMVRSNVFENVIDPICLPFKKEDKRPMREIKEELKSLVPELNEEGYFVIPDKFDKKPTDNSIFTDFLRSEEPLLRYILGKDPSSQTRSQRNGQLKFYN